jgi:hypothetical protein
VPELLVSIAAEQLGWAEGGGPEGRVCRYHGKATVTCRPVRRRPAVIRSNTREEWGRRRWDRERGIHIFDYNNKLVLLSAPVEDVCEALKKETARRERDVLGGEVVLGQEGLFVFRLRGHAWTEVLHNHPHGCTYELTPRWAGLLSRRLGTKAIWYCVNDTCSCTGYSFFQSGKLRESFEFVEGQPYRFRSEIRSPPVKELQDEWGFVEWFFVEQDAFEPGITFAYFLGRGVARPGERVIVQNPGHELADFGVSRPGMERVDYLELRPKRSATGRGRRTPSE